MVATPGRRLGRYHLVEPIGAGPCGEVYRAKVVGVAGMERQLAIKRFYPEVLALPDAGPRLQQASRSYGGLDHPRIARLSELGVAGGETFTATELVPGLDLGRLRQQAADTNDALPSGGVLALLSAAARAIGYAHGRGVCHWGIGPGNVIATPDGDVKVTDFGVLTCRLPARPSTDESLMLRLPYLAPEQLLGEPLSAASDVFSLGVLAYELVGGARPFNGASAVEIEHAIVSGRPLPLEVPRPIARVIDRCLARSPFERFPDARSLADALDAALRLSPLTGGKRDVGERVRVTLEHLARINEQQLSGALNFSVPTPPPRPRAPNLPLPVPMTTLTGPAPAPPPLPAPPRPFRASSAPPLIAPPTRPGIDPTQARPGRLRVETDLSIGDETGRIEPLWPPTEQVPLVRPPPSFAPPLTQGASPADTARAMPSFGPMPSAPAGSPADTARTPPPSFATTAESPLAQTHRGAPPAPPLAPPTRGVPTSQPPAFAARAAQSQPSGFAPPGGPLVAGPPMAYTPARPSRRGQVPPPVETPPPPPPRRRTGLWIALTLLVVAAAAAAVAVVMTQSKSDPAQAGTVATATLDAAPPPPDDAGPQPAIAVGSGPRVVGTVDSGTPAPLDAAGPSPAIDAGPIDAGPAPDAAGPARPATDKLTITSDPPGAQVFLDGAEQGKTPLVVPASADQYALALFAPGRDLYLAKIPGTGTHDANLTALAPLVGKGGIKVRCRTAGRYYVYIDGKPSGELCPTERIPAALGNHTVEIYDLVTEARRSTTVRVVQISRSTRVRMD